MDEPGGDRHPALLRLLEASTPVATELATWGALRLQFAAYLSAARLPDELITSVRCIVRFADRVVVTRSPDDVNVWPGGRREPGETIGQTAIREVYEETGCHLDPASLRRFGFLHARHLAPPPDGYPYPHPDFLQLVLAGRALDPPGAGWRDAAGYVQAAWLESPERARTLVSSALAIPFLDAEGARPGRPRV